MNLKDQLVHAIAGQIFVTGGSQIAMARRLGIRQADVSLLKNKAARMSLDNLVGIAEKLAISIDFKLTIGDVEAFEPVPVESTESALVDGQFKF